METVQLVELVLKLNALTPSEMLDDVTEHGTLSVIVNFLGDILVRLQTHPELRSALLPDSVELPELPEHLQQYASYNMSALLGVQQKLIEMNSAAMQLLAVLCSDGSSGMQRAAAREHGRKILAILSEKAEQLKPASQEA